MRTFSEFLIEAEDRAILYHGTSTACLDGIKREGLKPAYNGSGSYQWSVDKGMDIPKTARAVYVTTNFELASRYANITCDVRGGDPVVLTLGLPDNYLLRNDKASAGMEAFEATRIIPWRYVTNSTTVRRRFYIPTFFGIAEVPRLVYDPSVSFAESLFDTVDGYGGDTEVYKNPTSREITNIIRDYVNHRRELGQIVGATDEIQLAAFVSNNDMYVWDRDKAEHRRIKGALKIRGVQFDDDTVPVYMMVQRNNPSRLGLSFAGWTANDRQRDAFEDDTVLAAMLATRPPLHGFTVHAA